MSLELLAIDLGKASFHLHGVRWSPVAGQFGDRVKLGSGCRQAANLSSFSSPYASSGVHPARAE